MKATFMVIVTYPTDKALEVGQAHVKNTGNLPKTVKRVGQSPYAMAFEGGFKIFSIYETKDENLADAIRGISEYYLKFGDIEGLRWKLEMVLSAAEALPLLGLKPPE